MASDFEVLLFAQKSMYNNSESALLMFIDKGFLNFVRGQRSDTTLQLSLLERSFKHICA